MLPKTLKNFQLFIIGSGYAGRVDEVNLPKLTRKMEDHMAGGMNVPIEIDMGMEKIECDFTLCEYSPEVLKAWGAINHAGVGVRLMGAVERDDGSLETSTIEVVLNGRWKEHEFGAIKKGDKATLKVMMACTYYKLSIDGEELIEIDAVNMIEKINGVDRLASQRRAIGL